MRYKIYAADAELIAAAHTGIPWKRIKDLQPILECDGFDGEEARRAAIAFKGDYYIFVAVYPEWEYWRFRSMAHPELDLVYQVELRIQ